MNIPSPTLPLGADSVVGRNVNGVGGGVVAHCQAQVSDAAGAVLLHQNVLGLQVPVSNGRLAYTQTGEGGGDVIRVQIRSLRFEHSLYIFHSAEGQHTYVPVGHYILY